MPAPSVVLTNIAAAIATLTGGTRLWSDIGTEFDYIAPGELRFAVKSFVASINRTSNDNRPALGLQVTVYRRLLSTENERDYTEGVRLTHIESLVNPLWWKSSTGGIAGIYQAPAQPDTGLSDLTRVGDLITYTLTLAVVCVTP